ncbi:MAG: toxin TumE [Syntrophobacteraceae bacterium]|jgi:hypothetical protein
MLHDILRRYLEEAEIAIARIKDAYVEQYQEEILTPKRVNLRVRVRFVDGSLLELNEAVIVEANVIEHLDYRYHLQDVRNRLLLRYDNTPHFPDVDTFPHHKHVRDSVVPSARPSVQQAIEEAMQFLDYISSR